MFAILHFYSIIEFVLFYGVIFIVVGIIAFYFYNKSVDSRKIYKCTQCGEIYKTEHMDSYCCKVCGAPVDEIK